MSISAARHDQRACLARGLMLAVWCTGLAIAPSPATAQAVTGSVKHTMRVTLDAATHRLTVADTVRVARVPADHRVEFLLNAAFRMTTSKPAVTEVPLGHARFFSINGTSDTLPGVTLKRYRVSLPASSGEDSNTISVTYSGTIDFGLSDQKEEYTRGFRETAGIVGPQGVYLAGSGFWYPSFNQELLEFTLDVAEPSGWHVVSEGNGTSRDEHGHARWDSGGPMEEIHLVGGPLQVSRDTAGQVETLVYLHDRDEALAAKYLAATAQYLEMYRQLIGPYPYRKFALVENFWETGYGMPTFTLLGREIIRFPFIISSSYPHEILHNWWGNSVFVNDSGGNWCEGLTAYMADDLIQEQRGAGEDYRRSTLQKYRDYVKAGRDFPLTAFRVRSSAATEAVGYGKALMLFHMLRLSMGDDAFRKTVATFYRQFKGKRASFSDLEHVAEAVSGKDYSRFFTEQVTLAGAAELAISVESVKAGGGGYAVAASLRQSQEGDPLALDVPVILQTAGGAERQVIHLEARERSFTMTSRHAPVALHVDPYFDVFRKLDPRETPPSIGQIFGEPRVLALLPSTASAAELDAWRALFKGWQSGSHAIDVKLDTEVTALPRDRAVWVAGRSNRWAGRLFGKLPGMTVTGRDVEVGQEKMPLGNHTLVAVTRHPENVEKAVGWLVVDPAAAFPGLGRKLPHYGKYSYLGFEGDEPVNVLKGQWQESDSPLRVDLRANTAAATNGTTAALSAPPLPADNRKPLAELPPTFSQKALVEHVTWLADPAREGRGLGSAGERAAADYIAERFKAYGLQPVSGPSANESGWLQPFMAAAGDAREMKQVANVIGIIPGTKAEWNDQAVLVTAHYDHLGLGWPDVHKGDAGKVHPGADDNASGVAVMLELARVLATEDKPSRSVVFVAFTGEEAGLLGSKYYVEHPGRFPLAKTIGVINLDTVGRLGDQKVSILGTGTASEWQHIFMGATYVTGVESHNIPESIEASDQMSFIREGVPAVQIFTSAHADYHRPTDTADKIDAPGLVKVATLVREAVSYLAERPDPLTNTIPKAALGDAAARPTAAPGAAAPQPSGRRVSFGTVPDFAFEGAGVRVGSLVPGSPAEKAGVQAGDIIKAVDGRPVANLRAFSDMLRTFVPGQTVTATVVREGKEVSIKVTLAER